MTVLTRTFESAALVDGSYNVDSQELTLTVKGKPRKNGTRLDRAYTYRNVPAIVWVWLNKAESAGRYWIYQIQHNYPLA